MTTQMSISEFFDLSIDDILSVSHSYVVTRRLDPEELVRLRLALQLAPRSLGNQVAEDLASTLIVHPLASALETDFNCPAGSIFPAFTRHRLSRHPREEVDREREKAMIFLQEEDRRGK